jgi:hypothetical protein
MLPLGLRNEWLLAALLLTSCGSPPPPKVVGTAPPAGVTRYIVGGDSRDDRANVLPWSFREAKARGAAGFLFLGDMELTPTMDGRFEQELPLLDPVKFFPVVGNHEVKVLGFMGIAQPKTEEAFRKRFLGTTRTPVQSALSGKVVYSVDLPGGVHFIALDNVSQRGFGADQIAWLTHDLEEARTEPAVKVIFVGMHKPLAKNGVSTHSMDADGPQAIADSDAVLELFVQSKVSVIFASHVHELAAFKQRGIPSYITGGLGAPLVGSAGPEHAFHHFLQVDVRGDDVQVGVVRFDAASVVAPANDTENE